MERKEWTIRNIHKVVFEPPDICHIYVNGPAPLQDNKDAIEIVQNVAKEVSPIYLVTHIASGVEGFTAESRKYFGTLKPFWAASVITGGNTLTRAAMNVTMRAINLISGSPIPTRMVKTDEEAYAFINELRAAGKPKSAQG